MYGYVNPAVNCSCTLGTGIATDPNLAPLLAVLLLAARLNQSGSRAHPRPVPASVRRLAVLGPAALAVGAAVGVAYLPMSHPPAPASSVRSQG